MNSSREVLLKPHSSMTDCQEVSTQKIILVSYSTVAGSSGSGKTSLIFTLTRGIFPSDFVPGRFEGWSIAAAATPKESLNDLRKVPTGKAYLVNLTFWEDRPRLNLWEKEVRERKELEEAEERSRKKSEERRKKVTLHYSNTSSTVFEIHRKVSFKSELRLHFELAKVHENCQKNGPFLKGQKLVENATFWVIFRHCEPSLNEAVHFLAKKI